MTAKIEDVEAANVRDLTDGEIGDVSGGSISMGIAAVRVAAFLKSINFEFFGCTTEDGSTTCTSQYDSTE